MVAISGATWGGGAGASAPPTFHTCAKDMYRIEALIPCIIPSFLLHIYLPPFSNLLSCAPGGNNRQRFRKG